MKVTFLGTGTSHGVPSIDCMIEQYINCPKGVCKLAEFDPKHKRTRSSILIEWSECSVLIDVSADFRTQALRENIRKIDAVLITHSHADHIGGIPDIRSYTTKTPLPVYGSDESISNITKTFSYIFDPETTIGGGIPKLDLYAVKESFNIFEKSITVIEVKHGNLDGCFGYRIGPLAYIPDIKSIDQSNLEKLKGTEVLILNCLRNTPAHCTHLTLSESMELARIISPRICYFIHMCHDIHYETDSEKLESWMKFSFDGLVVNI
ncbi:MAG TPA: MBL fold metallo-hydrolase [Chitinispirillaceae bacterium]|nr:MBL fold metallo-hydrolase [Chitinispirillaceae bacterium]